MRHIALQQGQTVLTKNLLIIEGESGLGKSTLYEKLLQSIGYSSTHENSHYRYYKMSAASLCEATLGRIAAQSSVIILDEINLDPSLIYFLQGLLTQYPNFLVLASQNGVHYAGRHGLPMECLARSHYLVMDDYSALELEHVAAAILGNKKQAQRLVADYEHTKTKCQVNPRTFFRALAVRQHQRDDDNMELTKKMARY